MSGSRSFTIRNKLCMICLEDCQGYPENARAYYKGEIYYGYIEGSIFNTDKDSLGSTTNGWEVTKFRRLTEEEYLLFDVTKRIMNEIYGS